MKRLVWLRTPEALMVVLGVLAFGVDRLRGPPGDSDLIEVPPPAQIAASPQAIVGDEIVDGENRDPVNRWIRAEILYREALRLGLDENDIVVRRRLVQKMEYALDNMAALESPARAELEAFYARYAERYREPPTESFAHIGFSMRDGVDKAFARADAALAALRGRDVTAGLGHGDPQPDGTRVAGASELRLLQQFGAEFAEGLQRARVGAWDGPIRSRTGVHLVFRAPPRPSRTPGLDEVYRRVARDWVEHSRAVAREVHYAELAARYRVIATVDGTASDKAALTVSAEQQARARLPGHLP